MKHDRECLPFEKRGSNKSIDYFGITTWFEFAFVEPLVGELEDGFMGSEVLD